MEFDVLGPVRVTNAGEPLDIGGPKQRTVLSMLIAHHGHTVSGDALVQAVYGEDASPRRLRNIQTYVSILRSVVGDAIVRSGDGWSLEVDRTRIDALRFEDESRAARSTTRPGRIVVDSLLGALGLWRGSPYQDVDAHGFLDAERTRLEELRRAVQSARIEADLEAGRHAELIGELDGLLVEHPYSERLRAQHMLALYRAGRQREALASYSAARRRLIDELGVDPSTELQELERRILEHDPTLELPTPALGNLPQRTASFVGREDELDRLVQLVQESRLVTVTGVGGVGKTRLALAAAERLAPSYPGGVWLIELASVSDPDLVDGTVAAALGIDESAGRSPRSAVIEYLSTARTLLVFDNCEHLLAPVAQLVEELLRTTPHSVVLATSRELLGVRGEQAIAVPSMPTPPPGAALDITSATCFDSVELFAARARAAHEAFRLDDDNVGAVVEICRRVDGIPLAIELAALRVRTYPPNILVELLDDRFRILSRGARSALPRQQTLAATIEWSYRLLDPKEQAVFRRLSVFRAGWSGTAMSVVAGGDVEEGDLVELLPSLVDKSLVVVDDRDVEPRYSMLETVRQFALAAFEETDEVDAVRARHADQVEAFVAEVARQLTGGDDVVWLRRVTRELDNLRHVLTWCLEHDREEQALRIASQLWEYWAVVQRPLEGITWIRRTRSAAGDDVPDSLLARSLFAEGALLERSAGVDPEPLFVRAAELFDSLLRSSTDLDVVAECYPRTLHLMARMVANNKYDEERADAITHDVVAVAERLGDERTAEINRRNLERAELFDYAALRERPELARAARRYAEHDRAMLSHGPLRDRVWACISRAILELELGEAEEGATWFRRSSEIHREAGLAFLADFDLKRAELWRFLGACDGAEHELASWTRSLVGHPEAITNPKHLSEIVSDRTLVDARLGQWERSAIGWGIYDRLTRELEPNFPPTLRAAQAAARTAAQEALGADFDPHAELGSTMTSAQIVAHVSSPTA